jgi:hypothetical protein
MNKKLFFSAMVVFLLAFGLIVVSCGGDSSKLAGIWESDDVGTVELFSNGTGNWGGDSATWTAENNRLMVSVGGKAVTMDYKLSGKTLSLTYEGETMIFKKANPNGAKATSNETKTSDTKVNPNDTKVNSSDAKVNSNDTKVNSSLDGTELSGIWELFDGYTTITLEFKGNNFTWTSPAEYYFDKKGTYAIFGGNQIELFYNNTDGVRQAMIYTISQDRNTITGDGESQFIRK